MSGHFRIVCRRPTRTPDGGSTLFINGILPGLCETELFFVDELGKEHPVQCVSHIAWSVDPREAAKVTLTLEAVDADIDVEAGVFELKSADGTTLIVAEKVAP